MLNGRWRRSDLERSTIEGDSPVRGAAAHLARFQRVGFFDIGALSGR